MSEGVLQKPTELDRKEQQSSMDHQERIGYGVPSQFREVHIQINLPTRLFIINFHHYHVSHVPQ